MVSGIQILGILFSLILSYFTFLNYKRRFFTGRECIGWLAIWGGFAIVTLYPNLFQTFSGELGATRAFDTFSVIGFIVTLSISFYTYVNLDRLRKVVEKMVRDVAMKDIDNNK